MSTTRAALLACCALVSGGVATLEAAAQAGKAAPFVPARLWDGKTPDFRGIWQARGTAYVNLEGHAGAKGVAASPSIVVDPPDGKIPYTPAALAKRQDNYRERAAADPSLQVLSSRRAARDVSADAAADPAEPRQFRDRVPGEPRVPRVLSGEPAALRCRRFLDGRYALSLGRQTRWSPTSSR